MIIPLFGMCDTVTIKERTDTVSYGNVKISDTTILSNWACRKTDSLNKTTNELVIKQQGEVKDNSWYFTGTYSSLIKEGHIITDAANDKFEIIKLEPKRDAFGNYHHLYITTRKRTE